MERMRKLFLSCLLFVASGWVSAQSLEKTSPETSRCHVFIDDQNIWTVEILEDPNGDIVPILNIITFSPGGWDFRPQEIYIYNQQGKAATVERFSMYTGVPGEDYLMQYLKIRGNSFIGLDLLGEFDDFTEPTRVAIDLGEDRFQLKPLDCIDYDALAEKIDRINVDSPNLWEDFDVLQIKFLGEKLLRPEQ